MIVPAKTENGDMEADLSSLTDKQRENMQGTRYLPDQDAYEVTFTDKYERNLLKEQAKALEAENKALKERIKQAGDFKDFKEKVSKAENSKDSPTKWSDKDDLLEGEYIDHKGTIYISLVDHTASKDKEPPQEELYKLI